MIVVITEATQAFAYPVDIPEPLQGDLFDHAPEQLELDLDLPEQPMQIQPPEIAFDHMSRDDQVRALTFAQLIEALDELPDDHPLLFKLHIARSVGGSRWEELERGFVLQAGDCTDLSLCNYYSLIFPVRFEAFIDRFLASL